MVANNAFLIEEMKQKIEKEVRLSERELRKQDKIEIARNLLDPFLFVRIEAISEEWLCELINTLWIIKDYYNLKWNYTKMNDRQAFV